MAKRKLITYVTTSEYKVQENEVFRKVCRMKDGTAVNELFDFEIRPVHVQETLEVDITTMVKAEVRRAYAETQVPCIVEHAGLVFDDYKTAWYPGGLTKPMWDTLKSNFLKETASAGRRATARAVIGYCDGMAVRAFTGETPGVLADAPRGGRTFYWDTVFIPDDPSSRVKGKTYSEIVEDPSLGLSYKVEHLSQSSRAMLNFLEFLLGQEKIPLWPDWS